MLAKKFEERFWFPDGMFIQPKLNGVRAMYKAGMFMSRDGVLWNNACLQHLRSALAAFPSDVVLDGELYIHGLSLQQINSRCAVMRQEPHAEESTLTYNVFDLVSDEGFAIRTAQLQLLWLDYIAEADQDKVVLVPTHFAGLPRLADALFPQYKSLGYEGTMYRHPLMPYSLPDISSNQENRSKWLLKRKDWLDLDAYVLEVCSGNNRLANTCGSLSCYWVNEAGKKIYFSVGSGLTDMQRNELWAMREMVAEASDKRPWTIKVRYEMLSDGGVPLKPTVILVYNLP
jgi:ATP-dependent DNA ligase